MTDWTSPVVQAAQSEAFVKLVHAFVGIYFWEFLISFNFDVMFITGRKKFRWPMVPYFCGRYFFLGTMIGILVGLDSTRRIDCQPLYTFEQVGGNAAIGFSAINLAIRTMAIWNMDRRIVIGLILLILGHWSLILQGTQLFASWEDGQGCVITHTDNKILSATFIYSMCFDLIVMLLSAFKLIHARLGSSQIAKLLFHDGLVYFLIAFMANLFVTVFMILNLNPVMNIMFNVPAACADTIVACRVVRRLHKFASNGGEIYTGNIGGGTPSRSIRDLAFAKKPPANATTGFDVSTTRAAHPDAIGIHVQMDTLTTADSHDQRKAMRDPISDEEMALDSKKVVL